MKIKTLLQSLIAVASLVQVEANAMDKLITARQAHFVGDPKTRTREEWNLLNEEAQLNNYCVYLASQYFDTADDFTNLEIGCKRFLGNTSKFFYNPIPLNVTTREWFDHLKTLFIYSLIGPRFKGDKRIMVRKLITGPIRYAVKWLNTTGKNQTDFPLPVVLKSKCAKSLNDITVGLTCGIGFNEIIIEEEAFASRSAGPSVPDKLIFSSSYVLLKKGWLRRCCANCLIFYGVVKIKDDDGLTRDLTLDDILDVSPQWALWLKFWSAPSLHISGLDTYKNYRILDRKDYEINEFGRPIGCFLTLIDMREKIVEYKRWDRGY